MHVTLTEWPGWKMSRHRDDYEPDTAPAGPAGTPSPWALPRWLFITLVIWGAILVTLCTIWVLGSLAPAPQSTGGVPSPASSSCVDAPHPSATADHGAAAYGFQPGP
jgi:hypothetical protein